MKEMWVYKLRIMNKKKEVKLNIDDIYKCIYIKIIEKNRYTRWIILKVKKIKK